MNHIDSKMVKYFKFFFQYFFGSFVAIVEICGSSSFVKQYKHIIYKLELLKTYLIL